MTRGLRWAWAISILLPCNVLAAVVGIDPLEVLDTLPKANAVVLIDSSGAMRDSPYATSNNSNGISKGELVGSDPHSKLFLAKQALAAVVLRNQAKVSFKLGRFSQ